MLVSEDGNGGVRQLYRDHPPPYRHSPPLHYHRAFKETFNAEEGTLALFLGREPYCEMPVETVPAGGVVKASQLAYGVANDGGAARDLLPKNPIVRLRFIAISPGFLSGVPLIVQRIAIAVAAMISRITGTEKRLQQYITK